MAFQMLAGGNKKQKDSSSPLGLAGQLIGSVAGGGHGSSSGGGSGGKNSVPGKLVGALASNLFSSGNKPAQPQNYHGDSSSHGSSPAHGGGGLIGGVASFLGGAGGKHNQSVC